MRHILWPPDVFEVFGATLNGMDLLKSCAGVRYWQFKFMCCPYPLDVRRSHLSAYLRLIFLTCFAVFQDFGRRLLLPMGMLNDVDIWFLKSPIESIDQLWSIEINLSYRSYNYDICFNYFKFRSYMFHIYIYRHFWSWIWNVQLCSIYDHMWYYIICSRMLFYILHNFYNINHMFNVCSSFMIMINY